MHAKGFGALLGCLSEAKRYRGLCPWQSVLTSSLIYLKGFSDYSKLVKIYPEQVLCHLMAV